MLNPRLLTPGESHQKAEKLKFGKAILTLLEPSLKIVILCFSPFDFVQIFFNFIFYLLFLAALGLLTQNSYRLQFQNRKYLKIRCFALKVHFLFHCQVSFCPYNFWWVSGRDLELQPGAWPAGQVIHLQPSVF